MLFLYQADSHPSVPREMLCVLCGHASCSIQLVSNRHDDACLDLYFGLPYCNPTGRLEIEL